MPSEIVKDELSRHGMPSTLSSRLGEMNYRQRTIRRGVVRTAGKVQQGGERWQWFSLGCHSSPDFEGLETVSGEEGHPVEQSWTRPHDSHMMWTRPADERSCISEFVGGRRSILFNSRLLTREEENQPRQAECVMGKLGEYFVEYVFAVPLSGGGFSCCGDSIFGGAETRFVTKEAQSEDINLRY